MKIEVKAEVLEEESTPAFGLEDDLPPVLPKEEEDTDDFNFESESYALQHNKDYQMLVKALIRLETQKIQAIKGLEDLHEVREAVLKDPFAFVKSLQNGENLNLPGPIDIVEVPEIEWGKYDIHSIIQAFRPKTRRLAKENNASESTENTDAEPSNESKLAGKSEKVRSDTFNVPWTLEEQRKLEELLIKYPDEPMSSKRWAKISKELGTRSLMQVQSRVQKYFIALKKEGLPVPGKDPKRGFLIRQGTRKRSHYSQHFSLSKYMRAFDFESSSNNNYKNQESCDRVGYLNVKETDVSDEEDILDELKDTKEYQELVLLKRAKKLKLEEMKTGEIIHYGYRCDGCSCNPICGPRWHCADCPQMPSVDFCEHCAKHFQNDVHLSTHILKPVNALSIRDTSAFRSNDNNL